MCSAKQLEKYTKLFLANLELGYFSIIVCIFFIYKVARELRKLTYMQAAIFLRKVVFSRKTSCSTNIYFCKNYYNKPIQGVTMNVYFLYEIHLHRFHYGTWLQHLQKLWNSAIQSPLIITPSLEVLTTCWCIFVSYSTKKLPTFT